MNQDPTHPEPLIAAYLRDAERDVDAAAVLAGIRARRSRATHHRTRRSAIGVSAVAAALIVVVGFAWTWRQASAHTAAVRLVHAARQALGTTPSDRAYRIAIDLAPGMAERAPYLAALAQFDCRLWTRSDRLWIEGRRNAQVWACGRDDRRHIWIAGDPEVGIDFAPEDVPEPLDEVFDLFQFDLDSILHLLATAFDVTTLDDPTGTTTPGVTHIRGTTRRDHPRPRLRAITVTIDEQTKLVRQVVLARLRNGQPLAEMSFTFDQAASQADAAYTLAAHLDPDAPIYGRDQRLRRRRALTRFFGSLLLLQGE